VCRCGAVTAKALAANIRQASGLFDPSTNGSFVTVRRSRSWPLGSWMGLLTKWVASGGWSSGRGQARWVRGPGAAADRAAAA
jgi:hypothetical protein